MKALRSRAEAARTWLFEAALPVWAGAGFDARAGLFHERLDQTLAPTPGPRRVRVQARQVYVFALAGRLGWSGPWRERVEAGFATLCGPARADGGAVGHLLDERGVLTDERRDLYDIAFALFACAHASHSVPGAIVRANEIADFLDREWKSPQGGYFEGEVEAALPRWQNPRMHLLEASLALSQVDQAPRWRAMAAEMAGLFRDHFFQPREGVLTEWFTQDWTPAPGERGRLWEPGHQFEWSWLVTQWKALSGEDMSAAANALYRRAAGQGIGPHGMAIDELALGAGVKAATARLWPQTERLKAALAQFEAGGAEGDVAHACDQLVRYLDQPAEGLWRDRMRADGTFVDEPAPASSFYHIALAMAELMRVAGLA